MKGVKMQMEKYKQKLRRRIKTSVAAVAFAAVAVAVTTYFTFQVEEGTIFEGFVRGGATGLFFAAVLIGIIQIVSCVKALKNEEKLQKMFVEETDERNIQIYKKSASTAFSVSLYLLMLAFIITALLNFTTIAITLFAVLAVIVFVRAGAMLFYKKTL